jgi:hypothetical protein
MGGIAHFFPSACNIWYQPFWTFGISLEFCLFFIKLNLFHILCTKRDFVATLELRHERACLTVVLFDVLYFPVSHLSNLNTIKYYTSARSNYARTDYSWSHFMLRHISGVQSPGSRFRYPDTGRGQRMWDLCWRKKHWDRFLSGHFGPPPPPILFN